MPIVSCDAIVRCGCYRDTPMYHQNPNVKHAILGLGTILGIFWGGHPNVWVFGVFWHPKFILGGFGGGGYPTFWLFGVWVLWPNPKHPPCKYREHLGPKGGSDGSYITPLYIYIKVCPHTHWAIFTPIGLDTSRYNNKYTELFWIYGYIQKNAL